MISWTFENINILAMPNQKLCTVGGGGGGRSQDVARMNQKVEGQTDTRVK